MDTIDNMRAFLVIARNGSFASAARTLDLTPSVVTKRIAQLERLLGARLLVRSSRKVALTPEGEHHLARIAAAVAAHDDALAAVRRGIRQLSGLIRVKVPTSLGALRLNSALRRFARQHPGVELEILLHDGPLNPAAERVDIAITAFPASFDGVVDEFLWPIRRALVASPDYLARQEVFAHPRQLERLPCIVYQPVGRSWPFLGGADLVTVRVSAKIASNDLAMLVDAALDGEGLALLSRWIVEPHLASGALQVVLPQFPVPDLWLKAMVPSDRLDVPRIKELLRYLKSQEGIVVNGGSTGDDPTV